MESLEILSSASLPFALESELFAKDVKCERIRKYKDSQPDSARVLEGLKDPSLELLEVYIFIGKDAFPFAKHYIFSDVVVDVAVNGWSVAKNRNQYECHLSLRYFYPDILPKARLIKALPSPVAGVDSKDEIENHGE